MKKYTFLIILLSLCCFVFYGCRQKNETKEKAPVVADKMSIDTENLFFSGIMNHEKSTFYDFATGGTLKFEVAEDNAREVRKRFERAARETYQELYCNAHGKIERDTTTGKETLLINNANSFKRNAGEMKPPIPGKYYSTNTDNIYSFILNERYEYTLYKDEAVISEGAWGKLYDYTGVIMPDKNYSHPQVKFTLMYQLRNIYITMDYDGTYIIFQ